MLHRKPSRKLGTLGDYDMSVLVHRLQQMCHPGGAVDNQEGCACVSRGLWEMSVLSSLLYCEPKTNVYFFLKKQIKNKVQDILVFAHETLEGYPKNS